MKNFESTYYDSSTNLHVVNEYNQCLLDAHIDEDNYNKFDLECINLEIVDRALHKLHKGKAAGFDGIMAEHLIGYMLIHC